jgi:ABC-type glutathione transport system ATPase component
MKSVFIFSFTISLLSSCAEKTVSLADGRMVTQRKYDRMIQHALKTAEKEARKSVKGKMSRKQIREFENSESIPVELKMP